MTSQILWFHQRRVYAAIVVPGIAGLWGLGIAAMRKKPGPAFLVAAVAGVVVILVQVAAGVTLYLLDLRPANGFHVFTAL